MKILLYCFNCRREFGEAHIQTERIKIPICFDWCGTCEETMMNEFRRQFRVKRYLPQKTPQEGR